MKNFVILLLINCLALYSYSQDLGKNIDYQYQREGEIYHAYSLYANINRLPQTLNLGLLANSEIKELKSIQIKFEKSTTKIPFKNISTKIENDDPTLHQLVLNVELKKLTKVNCNSELKIVFIFADKTQYELPFNYCTIKEYL